MKELPSLLPFDQLYSFLSIVTALVTFAMGVSTKTNDNKDFYIKFSTFVYLFLCISLIPIFSYTAFSYHHVLTEKCLDLINLFILSSHTLAIMLLPFAFGFTYYSAVRLYYIKKFPFTKD